MTLVSEAICRVRSRRPDITFVFTSGNTVALKEDLIRGFHDVMLECEVHSHAKMNVMRLPTVDTWGSSTSPPHTACLCTASSS